MGLRSDATATLIKWVRSHYPNHEPPSAAWFTRETPAHTVQLDPFLIDRALVTNAQYRQFVTETGHPEPCGRHYGGGRWAEEFRPWEDERFNKPDHPVVCVSWFDACAYAQWAGKRLPTEAEWEFAARGGDDSAYFPWGSDSPDGTQCNFADKNTRYAWSDRDVDDGYEFVSPVGNYRPNPFGLLDMAGNVWEWCMDGYDASFYAASPRENPVSEVFVECANDDFRLIRSPRVLRGGSWYDGFNALRTTSRCFYHGSPESANSMFGFRCVKAGR